MGKIEAIKKVYGKLNKSIIVDTGEEITGWKIQNMTKKELLKTFTNQEIIWIYESGI